MPILTPRGSENELHSDFEGSDGNYSGDGYRHARAGDAARGSVNGQIAIIVNDHEPDSFPAETIFATAPELSILAKLARHSLMSLNLFTTIPCYFSPAEVGEMLATALGWFNLQPLFAKLFGIPGVVGNIFLNDVSIYKTFEAYREGILSQDNILIFGAINTAISDAARATLLSDTIYGALNKDVIYFDFCGAAFSNFFVNYLSLITLYAYLSRDAETLKKYDQLDALSFDLLGRSDDELIEKLSKFLCPTRISGMEGLSINADPTNNHDAESKKHQAKQLLTQCVNLSKDEFYEKVENYCEMEGLWDGQSTGYGIMIRAARASGILAAASLFKNNLSLYLNDLHLPLGAAAPLATLPLPPKGALYDRSWDFMLRCFRHLRDSVRNSIFLTKKDPRYLAFLVPMIALGIFIAPSGSGFYLVGEGALELVYNTFDIDPISDGALYDVSWLYKAIIVLVGLMTNEAAYFGACYLVAGGVQEALFPDENEASKIFAKMAKKLLDDTTPKTTVFERACNTYAGQAVCATASMVGSAASATASTLGSWISTAASYCTPSTFEGRQLLGGPISGYGSCGFFSNPNQTKKNPLVPSIARYLVPPC